MMMPPWSWWVQISDWSYRTSADHPYEVSTACRLPAELTKSEGESLAAHVGARGPR